MSVNLGIYTENPPTHWNDGLDWSLTAKPTLRHIQAILCAVSERATLTSGEDGNSLLVDLPYASNITIEMLNILASKIYKYLPPSFIFTDTNTSNLNRNKYFFSIGKECLNFDSQRAFWWNTELDEYATYGYYQDEEGGRFRNIPTMRDLSQAYFSKEVANKTLFIKGSHLDNNAIMQWLNEIKDTINKLHSIVVFPDVFKINSSNTPFPLTRSCWMEYEEHANGKTYGDKELHYILDAADWDVEYAFISGRYSCIVDKPRGDVSGYDRYWDYAFGCYASPYKVVNLDKMSFKLSAHFWQHAYETIYKLNEEDDNLVDVVSEKFLDFLPIEGFSIKGWNDFGIVAPENEVQIFSTNMCSNVWEQYPFYEAFDPTYKTIEFDMGVDAFLLDFRIDGGFKFI